MTNSNIFENMNLTKKDEEFLKGIMVAGTEYTPAVTFGEDPDDKVYLLLLHLYPEYEDEDSYRDWSIHTGRQATYDHLKNHLKYELIDPNQSFIIAGTRENDNFKPDSAPITVFRFMKVMFESHKVLDDNEDFDINEYSSYDEFGMVDKTILEV